MKRRQAEIEEKIYRDKSKEIMENRMREIYQEKKAGAMIKFESVMSNMIKNAMLTTTLNTMKDIEKPLFNKTYGNLLDQLSSYYQYEVTTTN